MSINRPGASSFPFPLPSPQGRRGFCLREGKKVGAHRITIRRARDAARAAAVSCYAMSCISFAPAGSRRTLNGSPVVTIGVDRRSVGGNDGARRRTGDGAILEVRQVCFKNRPFGGCIAPRQVVAFKCNHSPQERREKSTRDAAPTDRTPNQH